MYKGLNYSPQFGSFAFGSNPGPSDLENLVSGRERKITDLVDQSVYESLLGGNVDVAFSSAGKWPDGIWAAFASTSPIPDPGCGGPNAGMAMGPAPPLAKASRD